jgi:hypothetical protein
VIFIWIYAAKANLESSVGVLAMAGRRGVSVLVTPTNDFGEVLARMQGTRDPCFPSLFIC